MAAQLSAGRGASARGFDTSPDLLAVAQERLPFAVFLVGNLKVLPYTDDSFDLVTGLNAFQYIGNPGVAPAEVKRVARCSS